MDLVLEFSHTSSVKDHIWEGGYRPSSTTEATYDWEFRVKDANNGDMKQYIEKVVINLHETFKNPKKSKLDSTCIKDITVDLKAILIYLYFYSFERTSFCCQRSWLCRI